MALVYKDRVKETTTTTGTGTITLAGAVTGYQAFSVIGDGNTCIYVIEDANGTGWEVGVGTYTLSGTTLARTTVLASSNSGSAITLSSGTHDVYVSADARGLAQGTLPIKAETVTTANVTAVANTHHVCAITGLTADRNFVLPTPTAIGDRIRVTVTDGDDTYELVLIGDTGVKINGGTAATEWSRLLNAGESVQFVATAADDWSVEIDGRIACIARIETDNSTAQTVSSSAGAITENGNLQVTAYNKGCTITAGSRTTPAYSRIAVRRAGKYLVVGCYSPDGTVTDGTTIRMLIRNITQAKWVTNQGSVNGATSNAAFLSCSAFDDSAAGDAYGMAYASSTADVGVAQFISSNSFQITEIL